MRVFEPSSTTITPPSMTVMYPKTVAAESTSYKTLQKPLTTSGRMEVFVVLATLPGDIPHMLGNNGRHSNCYSTFGNVVEESSLLPTFALMNIDYK